MIGDTSRLSSITEEDFEHETEPKTQLALLKVYHELYNVDYSSLSAPNPKSHFSSLAARLNDSSPSPIAYFCPFRLEGEAEMKKRQKKYLEQKNSKSNKEQVFLSVEELREKLNMISPRETASPINTPDKVSQSVQAVKAVEETTATTTASISDILTQLKEYDDNRSHIKYSVYTEETDQMDSLYAQWSEVHTKMKQALEVYIDRLGHGKSLPQIYETMANNKKGKLEGIPCQMLYSKLDFFLQSLYSDERQLLLYRGQRDKALSVKSLPQVGARRRLHYE